MEDNRDWQQQNEQEQQEWEAAHPDEHVEVQPEDFE